MQMQLSYYRCHRSILVLRNIPQGDYFGINAFWQQFEPTPTFLSPPVCGEMSCLCCSAKGWILYDEDEMDCGYLVGYLACFDIDLIDLQPNSSGSQWRIEK